MLAAFREWRKHAPKAWNAFTLEMVLLAAVLSGFLHALGFAFFLAAQLVVGAAFVFFLAEARKHYGKDFAGFAVFFLSLYGLIEAVQFTFIVQLLSFQSGTLLLAASIVLLFVSLLVRSLQQHVLEGKVLLSGNGMAVVATDFDFSSFTLAGRYVVKAHKAYKKNEKVLVALSRLPFGRKPESIIISKDIKA